MRTFNEFLASKGFSPTLKPISRPPTGIGSGGGGDDDDEDGDDQPEDDSWKMKPYSGWTNWHTWNCNLWLSNVEHHYRYCRHKSAAEIRRYVLEQEIHGDGFNPYVVDWDEVASHFNEA